jgi:hypothetical protein
MNDTAKPYAVVATIICALCLIGAGWLYWESRHVPDKVAQVVIATPAKEVKNTPKKAVKPRQVEVYKGGATLKSKLNLPEYVIADQKVEIIASSKVPASEHSKTVTTTLNAETGASETYVRTDPLPWLAYESRGEIGAYYGLKHGEPTVRLQFRQDFVQVKALHAGVIASVDRSTTTGRTESFVGLGVSYRW